MKILGDSQITNADITATNILVPTQTDKLKNFQLTDNMRTIANSTVIDITFNGTIPNINSFALCGTNLTSNAVITLSYSNTDINSPENTITLPIFSTLHQVFFLANELNRKYWRISIIDTSLSTIFIGYIYTGVHFQVPFVGYGHEAFLDINSNSQITPTGQGYGSKIFNSMPVNFTMYANYADLEKFLAIIQEKQNIDPVLLIEYDNSYDLSLYRPKYGVLSNTSTAYPTREQNYAYEISARLEERF